MSIFGKVIKAIGAWLGDVDQEYSPLESDDQASLRQAISAWIDAVSIKNTLPPTCAAIYIGTVEEEPTYRLYLVGSDEYDQYRTEWVTRHDFVPTEWELDTGVPLAISGEDVFAIVVDEVLGILDRHGDTILDRVPHITAGHYGFQNIK